MNPYLLAERRQAGARLRAAPGPVVAGALAPAVAAWVAGQLVPASFFAPGPDVAGGLADIHGRVAVLLAAGVSLAAYQLVVRGPDRGVVDLHPVLARPWFVARLRAVALATAPWLLAALSFEAPLLHTPAWYLGGVATLVLAWVSAVAIGVAVNVAAPAVGLDPRWAAVLDAARGPNPRLQAALLYAPGVSLCFAGAAALAGATGIAALPSLHPAAALAAVPLLGAAGMVTFGGSRAADVARYPAVLGEIQAAWAAAEGEEEDRHVYLDWVVRLAPAPLRIHLLRELRHLWRTQRGWALAAWGFAALAALDAWSGGSRFGVLGVAVVGLAGARLAAEDPRWLEEWLGIGAPTLFTARLLAVWVHLQVVVIGAAAGLLRGDAGPLVAAELAALLLAAVAAGTAWASRARPLLVYLPVALVVGGVLT